VHSPQQGIFLKGAHTPMARRFAVPVCILALCAAAPSPVFAWGDLGHRMVCNKAWDDLTEEARAKVLDILDAKTQGEFADSCNWADAYREGHRETGPWHYISVPKGATEVIMERDCPVETSCAVREIERQFAILKSPVPKVERAQALMFLAHFVGDLHQPLHTGFAEDRRGTMLKATFFGEDWTMHGIWDYALVEYEYKGDEKAPVRFRPVMSSPHTFEWVDAPPLTWANESLAILRSPATGYVGNPGGLEFGEIYVNQNRPIVLDQIAKAGVRLARLLEQAMKHYP